LGITVNSTLRPARSIRVCGVLAALFCAIAVIAPAADADEAAQIYEPETVNVIHLGLSAEAEAALELEPDEYVKGTFSMAKTDGTPGGEETLLTPSPMKVEVRLKGDASFEPLTGKAAFKLKFKKTERFLGLRKMTLNNMHEDASMIHETLAYASFRANGVPAPRTSFAYVYVNGEDFGLELNVETVDANLLEKRFGSFNSETQHLFEGEDGTDVIPGDAPEFEVDEGEEGNIADLEALIEAVNSEGPEPWSTRVAPFADLGEMTAMWGVEKYTGHWDGYAGQPGQNGHQPNNYYLASLPGGEFQMLPWGTDETFQQNRHIPFEGRAGVLFNFCMEDPACATTYWKSLDAAVTAIEGLDLDAMAARLADLQAPWQQIEKDNDRHRWDIEHIEDGVAETRDFLTSRSEEARDWLALNDPRPQTTIDTPPPAASNDPTPTISFSSSKPNSSFQCKLDAGAFAPCTSPDTLAALADGPHSFEVRATDALGNADPDAALANFSIDTAAPQTTITGRPAARSRDRTPRFRFSSADPAAVFTCSIDSKPFRPCRSPQSYGKLDIGKHLFQVRATDEVSNEAAPTVWKFRIVGRKASRPGRRH
jgi:hypothetical protein